MAKIHLSCNAWNSAENTLCGKSPCKLDLHVNSIRAYDNSPRKELYCRTCVKSLRSGKGIA